jgi:hypothetical protein
MSALVSSPVGILLFDVIFNTYITVGACCLVGEIDSRGISAIVAVDTVVRIALTYLLSSMLPSSPQSGLAGHLIIIGLTLPIQLLSVKIARWVFNINQRWETWPSVMAVLGYIALSWKMNMMVKEGSYMMALPLRRV